MVCRATARGCSSPGTRPEARKLASLPVDAIARAIMRTMFASESFAPKRVIDVYDALCPIDPKAMTVAIHRLSSEGVLMVRGAWIELSPPIQSLKRLGLTELLNSDERP